MADGNLLDACADSGDQKPRKRGFAAMSSEQHKEICSKGGKAAHAQGVAHRFTIEEARRAGRLGGAKVSADREHMADIGRKGAQRRATSMPDLEADVTGFDRDC